MTLRDWCLENGVEITEHTTPNGETGAVSLIPQRVSGATYALWHLEDYAVSSVSGPVVWLVPRQPALTECAITPGE